MATKSCQACGATNRADAIFCYACGGRVAAAPPVQPSVAARDPGSRDVQAAARRPLSTRAVFWMRAGFGALALLLALATGLYGLWQWNPRIFEGVHFQFLTGFEEISGSRRVSSRETERLAAAAVEFPRPAAPGTTEQVITVDDLVTRGRAYKNTTVTVQGMVTRVARAENLQPLDWPEAAVLELTGAEKNALVLYPGSVRGIQVGELVEARGVYNSAEEVLVAQRVQGLEMHPVFWEGNDLWLLRAAVLVGAWMILCVAVLLARARYHQLRVLALLATLALAGVTGACNMHITTIVKSDGSGVILTEAIETHENMDWLGTVPGMTGYIQAVQQDLRSQGMLVSSEQTGDSERIIFQRAFSSPTDLAVVKQDTDNATWIFLDRYNEGNELVFRFTALVDTRTFYKSIEKMDSNSRNYLTQQFNQMELIYTVDLPGEIVFHNGSETTGSRVNWRLRNNDLNRLVAEARLPLESAKPALLPQRAWIMAGLALVAMFSTVILLVGLLRYRAPKRGRE